MIKRLAVLAALLSVFSIAVSAQTITASITGTVSDPTGAVVPSAKITATNAGTNLSYAATTNQSGVYNLLFLPVGQYNVTSEFNHASWGPPGRDITSPASFGQITSQVQNPRNIQFGLKYRF
jgi:hypothetical protein